MEKERKLEIVRSKGLTVYTRDNFPNALPEHHKQIASPHNREDAEYYSDVRNITGVVGGKRSSSSAARPELAVSMQNMIRLSAESAAFYQSGGWEYENYIGARILYPALTEEIKQSLFENKNLQSIILKLAIDQVSSLDNPHIHLFVSTYFQLSKSGIPAPISKPLKKAGKSTENWWKYLINTGTADEDEYTKALGKVCERLRQKMHSYIHSLVADLSSRNFTRFGAFVVNNILVRMYNQGIHIKSSEFMQVRNAALEAEKNGYSLIFLPCHKSHVDYVVISYILYRLGIALPHIAAGENLNLPFVGPLLKHAGAFFIRRTFGDDLLYQEVFREYIELLLCRGHNIEVFIEGTRSRTGKLLNPRFGVLKIILDSLLNGKIKDAIVVPISIDYDKVIETESYVTELLGKPKQKESLAQILNNANILSLKLGRIDIRFAKPFSLTDWSQQQITDRSNPQEVFSPLFNKNHRSTLLQSLGYRVLSDINSVSVIMPTALVGCVILTLRGRGIGREELIRRVTWLRREIIVKGGRVADFGGADVGAIVDRALNALSAVTAIRQNLLEPVIYPTKRFELSLYRNQVIHHFVHESFVCAAMYTVIKKGRTHLHIGRGTLLDDVVFLSKILKGEFIFRPGPVESNLDEAIRVLHHHNVIDVEDLDGSLFPIRTKVEEIRLPSDYFVRLGEFERKIGRENFDFYCFLIWPFIETYWLAAVSLFTIIPTVGGGLTENQLMDRVQRYGRSLYYEGDLGYFESISKETLRNALKRYQEMGILAVNHFIADPLEGEYEGKKQELFFLHPSYESECEPFLQDPELNNLGMYKTKLWNFVETIGKYRREGKHRRDNEVTGLRVLRLAALARL